MKIEQISLDKKLIFTVTPGRSGTTYLTKLLATLPDVTSLHEPDPNFFYAMRLAQEHPIVAYNFLYQYKLPAILQCPTPVYAESSHLVCKGFIEPMIRMGLRPHLVILRRHPREVAWSFFQKGSVPTKKRGEYLLFPTDRGVIPLPNWEELSDYQLCFWYALEIERRQHLYAAWAKELNMTAFDVTNTELNDWTVYARLLTALGLPVTDDSQASHGTVSAETHNRVAGHHEPPAHLAREEEAVWDVVSMYHPILRDQIARRYA